MQKIHKLIYFLQIILCGSAELLTINVQNQVNLSIRYLLIYLSKYISIVILQL